MTMMKTTSCLLAAAILIGFCSCAPSSNGNTITFGNHDNNNNNHNGGSSGSGACLVGWNNCRDPNYNSMVINGVKKCCVQGFLQINNNDCLCSTNTSGSNISLTGNGVNFKPMTKEEKEAFDQQMEETRRRLRMEAAERARKMKEFQERLARQMQELRERLEREAEERRQNQRNNWRWD